MTRADRSSHSNKARSEPEAFDDAVGKLLSTPKAEIDKRLAAEKKAREKKRKA